MDTAGIQEAFEHVADQALVFHGFTDYMRDYDVFIYGAADPRTGIQPEYLRYRFRHCVQATAATRLGQTWRRSLDDRLTDYEQGRDLDGYVWGVRWQELYPGMRLIPGSGEALRWSRDIGISSHEAVIEANAQSISLVFSDLSVDPVMKGYAPFVIPGELRRAS
jgi:hypothetical protein